MGVEISFFSTHFTPQPKKPHMFRQSSYVIWWKHAHLLAKNNMQLSVWFQLISQQSKTCKHLQSISHLQLSIMVWAPKKHFRLAVGTGGIHLRAGREHRRGRRCDLAKDPKPAFSREKHETNTHTHTLVESWFAGLTWSGKWWYSLNSMPSSPMVFIDMGGGTTVLPPGPLSWHKHCQPSREDKFGSCQCWTTCSGLFLMVGGSDCSGMFSVIDLNSKAVFFHHAKHRWNCLNLSFFTAGFTWKPQTQTPSTQTQKVNQMVFSAVQGLLQRAQLFAELKVFHFDGPCHPVP